jgi:Kef-type K+ transport system membrane component KefB
LWAWDEWQVETVAQFGVVFLLFALGLEFSMSKLRVVRAVAVIGGFLQIALFMCLCSLTAVLCGAKASEGIFVGAFLSMSSTAVVLKFLMDRNGTTALHGQVTIGTLILQVYMLILLADEEDLSLFLIYIFFGCQSV